MCYVCLPPPYETVHKDFSRQLQFQNLGAFPNSLHVGDLLLINLANSLCANANVGKGPFPATDIVS